MPPQANGNNKGVGSATMIALDIVGILPLIAVGCKLDVLTLQMPYHIIK
jgi:hypothetical protein